MYLCSRDLGRNNVAISSTSATVVAGLTSASLTSNSPDVYPLAASIRFARAQSSMSSCDHDRRSGRSNTFSIRLSSWWMRRINRMLLRCFDFTVRSTDGRTQTAKVLSSNSLRTSRCFRLMPFGMAEYADVGRWISHDLDDGSGPYSCDRV